MTFWVVIIVGKKTKIYECEVPKRKKKMKLKTVSEKRELQKKIRNFVFNY